MVSGAAFKNVWSLLIFLVLCFFLLFLCCFGFCWVFFKNLFPAWGWTGKRHVLGENISWGAPWGVDLGFWADNSVCNPLFVSFLCNLCLALLWTSKCLHCFGINREKFPSQAWGSWFPGKPCWDSSPSPPCTWGRRAPFITRKHLKAGLISRVMYDIFGVSVSTQNVSSFPEFPCVESLDLGRENCWSCVCTHPGSASASGQETETLREFRARESLHGTTARLWDGSGVWMSSWSTKPPSRVACDPRAEPVRRAGSVQTL